LGRQVRDRHPADEDLVMRFSETKLAGVFVIDIEPANDERGFFARIFCEREFAAAGIPLAPPQINLSRNTAAYTLRGMHFQPAPFAEAKLVRVASGRLYDVAIDLRPDSATFRQWAGAELSAENGRAMFLPEGIAHGFLTLEPATDVLYLMGREFVPGHHAGVRWNDPAFGVVWPAAPAVISERDASYPDFTG
jgi:dTDP-4-dehydrorhamnose 3,5-epimerase